MKMILRSLPFIALLLITAAAHAGPIGVEVQDKSSRKGGSGKDKYTISQEHTLTINITNPSQISYDALKVKTTFFGRDLSAKDVSVLSSGEKTAAVGAHGAVSVQSDAATATYTERHMEKKTNVPASGSKYIGYAVQVFAGSALMGEAYSSPELKGKLGTN